MKKQTLDAIFIFLIVFVILFCVWLASFLINEKTKCISNPFIYTANQIDGNVSCVCYEQNEWGIFPMHFNKSNYWAETVNIKNKYALDK